MPVSNFHHVLKASPDGTILKAAGPFSYTEVGVHSVHVFAVVTQQPLQCKPAEGDNDDPSAVTCRGNVHLKPDAQNQWTTDGSGTATWSFDAHTVGGGQFKDGWARGSALALLIKTNGDIETYSWSTWVWIDRGP
jgi:hypothetical protein